MAVPALDGKGNEAPGKVWIKNSGADDNYLIGPADSVGRFDTSSLKNSKKIPWKKIKAGGRASVSVKPGDKLWLESEQPAGAAVPSVSNDIWFKAKAPNVKAVVGKPDKTGAFEIRLYAGADKVNLKYLEYKIGEDDWWKPGSFLTLKTVVTYKK